MPHETQAHTELIQLISRVVTATNPKMDVNECIVCFRRPTRAWCLVSTPCAKNVRTNGRPVRPHVPCAAGVVIDLEGRQACGTTTGFQTQGDRVSPQTHAGITLSDAVVSRGVRVTGLHVKDRALACGFRRGDVITHINDIPVKDHASPSP